MHQQLKPDHSRLDTSPIRASRQRAVATPANAPFQLWELKPRLDIPAVHPVDVYVGADEDEINIAEAGEGAGDSNSNDAGGDSGGAEGGMQGERMARHTATER